MRDSFRPRPRRDSRTPCSSRPARSSSGERPLACLRASAERKQTSSSNLDGGGERLLLHLEESVGIEATERKTLFSHLSFQPGLPFHHDRVESSMRSRSSAVGSVSAMDLSKLLPY